MTEAHIKDKSMNSQLSNPLPPDKQQLTRGKWNVDRDPSVISFLSVIPLSWEGPVTLAA